MIARTNRKLQELYPYRKKTLTRKTLEQYFTHQQLDQSTYTNRIGTYIRLFNSNEATANVPSLYKYDKQYIVHFQGKYSNVGSFSSESANSSNRKLDVLLDSERLVDSPSDTRVNPPLPTPTLEEETQGCKH